MVSGEPMQPACLSFDKGSILIRGEVRIPYTVWDYRMKVFRAQALYYREIVEYLERSKLSFEDGVQDLVPCPNLKCKVRLRDYQEQALRSWNDGGRRGVIVLPTGAGKTVIALKAIELLNQPSVVVVPTLDLVEQWRSRLEDEFGVEVGVYGGGDNKIGALTVSTYDSAYLRAGEIGNRFNFIVFDEVHHLAAEGYRQIAEMFTAPYRMGLPEALERTIYCDVDEELILRDFEPIEADLLIKQYNLSVTQTLLFKSLRMEFTCSGNWQKIFRSIKRLGLMYSIERGDQGNIVSVDGPLSLFKMVDRYGTSVAKLLPQIVASKSWKIRAEVLGRNRDRIYLFELGSDQVRGFMEDVPVEEASKRSYDSSVEEHFARSFMSYDSGWKLEREPEPLVAGNYVLIPDFKFTKANLEVYLEIVGFWTQDYLEKKVSKLKSLTGVDMIVAVNENYAGSKFGKIKAQIIYYRNSVPIKPILDHLRKSEEAIRQSEAKVILPTMIRLEGDIVDIEDIARKHSISVESAKEVLQNLEFEGYRRIGDSYVSISKLEEIGDRLRSTVRLSDALALIGAYGIRNMYKVIEALGYTVEWNGLDLEKSKISKKQS